MIVYKVSIPTDKQSFFQEFLDIIGAEYEKNKKLPFELSEANKKTLDSQNDLPLSQYQDNDEFLEELKKEHGL